MKRLWILCLRALFYIKPADLSVVVVDSCKSQMSIQVPYADYVRIHNNVIYKGAIHVEGLGYSLGNRESNV